MHRVSTQPPLSARAELGLALDWRSCLCDICGDHAVGAQARTERRAWGGQHASEHLDVALATLFQHRLTS